MAKFRVVVTDQVFPDVDVECEMFEAAGGELVVARSHDEALELIADADGILTTYLPMTADVIAAIGKAKIIARYGIGVDNIDLAAARAAGIAVTNVPDYCLEEVATHAMALMLMLLRRIPQGVASVTAGGWGVAAVGEVHRLSSLTVGLLGYGRIGRRVAAAIEALGGHVVIHDPYVSEVQSGRLVSAGELFATASVLSMHCPLTPETKGIVNRATLGAMPPGSYLVNTSRGPIVVLDDLIEALREGRTAGAALDVLDLEPPDPAKISAVPNLIVTPHSAFLSVEALHESQRKAAAQILHRLRGEPLDYEVSVIADQA